MPFPCSSLKGIYSGNYIFHVHDFEKCNYEAHDKQTHKFTSSFDSLQLPVSSKVIFMYRTPGIKILRDSLPERMPTDVIFWMKHAYLDSILLGLSRFFQATTSSTSNFSWVHFIRYSNMMNFLPPSHIYYILDSKQERNTEQKQKQKTPDMEQSLED